MKKIIAFLLVLILTVSMVGCRAKEDDIIGMWRSEPYKSQIFDEFVYDQLYFFSSGEYIEYCCTFVEDYEIDSYKSTWYVSGNKVIVTGEYGYTFKCRSNSNTFTAYGLTFTKIA